MRCLTEDQIECRVERMIDRSDSLFMAGLIDQKQYDSNIAEARRWSDQQYFANKRIRGDA